MQKGFSLIEVLLAVVILSVGLLGLAFQQLEAAQMGSARQLESRAIALSNELIELVKANPDGWAGLVKESGDAFPTDTASLIDATTPPTPAPTACTRAAPCSAAVMARLELINWKNKLDRMIPGITAAQLENDFVLCRDNDLTDNDMCDAEAGTFDPDTGDLQILLLMTWNSQADGSGDVTEQQLQVVFRP